MKTPKGLRLHIAIFGRTNVGKSTFLNMVTGQDVSITSPIAGTTTDVVEKAMELLPIGPVLFIDTAGIDDQSLLAEKRLEKTAKVFDRTDIGVIVTDSGFGSWEENIISEFEKRKVPFIIAVNKMDLEKNGKFGKISAKYKNTLHCSSIDKESREKNISAFKQQIINICPDDFISPPPLLGDIVRENDVIIMIVPIDMEAPKGRLILPQVQAIRDGLDFNCNVIVTKENTYSVMLGRLSAKPDLVICDSQVVDRMADETPDDIPCTTFSILFSRNKGDLQTFYNGAMAIDRLKDGDTILIAEACTHHALEDDIGRVKIPNLLRKYTKAQLSVEVCSGKDFPDDLSKFSLILQCGGCMINRREMLSRIEKAGQSGVPITNYGLCISKIKGVLSRVTALFNLDVHDR